MNIVRILAQLNRNLVNELLLSPTQQPGDEKTSLMFVPYGNHLNQTIVGESYDDIMISCLRNRERHAGAGFISGLRLTR